MHNETNSGDMFYGFIGDELEKSQKLLEEAIPETLLCIKKKFIKITLNL